MNMLNKWDDYISKTDKACLYVVDGLQNNDFNRLKLP